LSATFEFEYLDEVLSPLVTAEREEIAIAEVDAIAAFPVEWRGRLIVLRTYIIVCLDFASASDDPFTLKLGQYQTQYDAALADARAAAAAAARAAAASWFSIPLERA
jgi:hypothetical protein